MAKLKRSCEKCANLFGDKIKELIEEMEDQDKRIKELENKK